MLADGVTEIVLDANGCPLALPAYPQIRLWTDSATALRKSIEGLERVAPGFENTTCGSPILQ